MVEAYVPDRGDVIWVTFSETLGHEQSGRRPALVLSSIKFNSRNNLCVVCPITTKVKNYSFEVAINTEKISGVVLSDQVLTISYFERKVRKITSVETKFTNEVTERIKILIS